MNEPLGGDGAEGTAPDETASSDEGSAAHAPGARAGRGPAPGGPAPGSPARASEVQPDAGLPAAHVVASAAALTAASLADAEAFPDDGPVSEWLRRLDRALGVAEQGVLFFLLGAVVLTAAAAALSDRVLGMQLGRWWFDVVRGGTFSVAMIGAVFATHQQRHLSMDLVSRRLPARGRLVLRVILALFTVLVAALLVRSGLHQLDTVGEESGDHLISTHTIVTFMPVGAVLIIVHTLLHMVIDIEYLVRGKTPPQRMRSGH